MPSINSPPTKTVAETSENDDDLKKSEKIEKPEQIENEKKAGRLANFLSGFRKKKSELKTLELWISISMLDLLVLLNFRLI